MQYVTCPLCNSNLDFGEKCDCQEKREEKAKKISDMLQVSGTGQMSLKLTTKQAYQK